MSRYYSYFDKGREHSQPDGETVDVEQLGQVVDGGEEAAGCGWEAARRQGHLRAVLLLLLPCQDTWWSPWSKLELPTPCAGC